MKISNFPTLVLKQQLQTWKKAKGGKKLRGLAQKGIILLAILVLVLALSGCGQSDSGKVKLDFMWFSDGNEGEVMKGIIKDYEKEHPNIEINLIEVAFKDIKTKLKTMVAGGKPPALTRINDTGAFVDQSLDLTPYVGDKEKFASQFDESIKPFYIIGDKIVAAPMDITVNCLYYNKTLFKKAGVTVPQSKDDVWTWEQFEDALKKVKEKGGARYSLVTDFSGHRWSTMLYEYGGSIFNKDLSKSVINSKEGVQALTEFVKLHEEGLTPDSVWLGGENPNNLFRSGTVGAHLAGNWMLGSYKDIHHFDWGVTYLPKEASRGSVPGGKYVMGFKGTGVEKETADFINYLTSQKVNAKYTKESLFMSPRKDNKNLKYDADPQLFKVFNDELDAVSASSTRDWANQSVMSVNAGDLTTAIAKAVKHEQTPQEALDDAAKIFNETIEKNKKAADSKQ
ncbi:sugar ABC transporter substrate-binding protein [Metabacillus sp. GX 13764]|uniref:ABC transporter substrate-binding protein n=1 Tax=Metabacillus kandeliae TaxID=2900151 RepID=UPI001E5F3A62|nr:sugar ABC transporter substrate-binding protein [Metabacillus kandeliae]MCD7033684.1 sugar ABC transporter substrate-binding protein [Metabacillus kandeliae]